MTTQSLNGMSQRRQVLLRTAAAVLLGYVFTWGFIALGTAGLFALGLPFHDAEQLCSILGVLLYLVVFLWAFSVRKLLRFGGFLAGAGMLMTVAASLVQRGLV